MELVKKLFVAAIVTFMAVGYSSAMKKKNWDDREYNPNGPTKPFTTFKYPKKNKKNREKAQDVFVNDEYAFTVVENAQQTIHNTNDSNQIAKPYKVPFVIEVHRRFDVNNLALNFDPIKTFERIFEQGQKPNTQYDDVWFAEQVSKMFPEKEVTLVPEGDLPVNNQNQGFDPIEDVQGVDNNNVDNDQDQKNINNNQDETILLTKEELKIELEKLKRGNEENTKRLKELEKKEQDVLEKIKRSPKKQITGSKRKKVQKNTPKKSRKINNEDRVNNDEREPVFGDDQVDNNGELTTLRESITNRFKDISRRVSAYFRRGSNVNDDNLIEEVNNNQVENNQTYSPAFWNAIYKGLVVTGLIAGGVGVIGVGQIVLSPSLFFSGFIIKGHVQLGTGLGLSLIGLYTIYTQAGEEGVIQAIKNALE